MYLKLATTNIQGEEEEGGWQEKDDKEEEKDALVFVLARPRPRLLPRPLPWTRLRR